MGTWSERRWFQVINTGEGLGLKRRMHFLPNDHIIQCVSFLAGKNFPLFEDIESVVTLKYLHSMFALMLNTNDQEEGRRGEI
jgi:hypothetical protein